MSRKPRVRTSWASILRFILPVSLLTGCATERYYAYQPAGAPDHDAGRAQRGKASYPIPPETPAGNVRVMSGGIVKLKSDKTGEKFHSLHLRMVISNQSSDTSWTVNSQAQSISLPNISGRITPVHARSDSETTQSVTVPRGEMTTLDLYFRLPENKESARRIPEFEFHWQVMVGTRSINETTAFDRVSIEPNLVGPWSNYYPSYYSWGFWPYSPFGMDYWWPSPTIVIPSAPQPPPSKPVIIH